MKKIHSILMIAASLTILWGCGSSDGDDNNPTQGGNNAGGLHGVTVASAPHWTFDTTTPPPGDIQGKPDWNEVNFYDFENNMTAIVFLSNDFGVKISQGDRMAAIVDGEVRDISEPYDYNIPDSEPVKCFMLFIPFDSDENGVELQYYRSESDQTYIAKNIFSVNDDTVGDDELFLYTLCPMTFRAITLPKDLPFTPSPDDEMAVFIGDECCGVAERQSDTNGTPIWLVSAYDMKRSGEKAHVRYYSAQVKTIYETAPHLDLHFDINDVASVDTLKFK